MWFTVTSSMHRAIIGLDPALALIDGQCAGRGERATKLDEFTQQSLVIDIPDATLIGTAQVAPTPNDAFIPAGAYITKATLVVTTAWTSGGSGTLSIGLFTLANAAIDADGIDATIAKTALAVNTAVDCDGALVSTQATVGAADAYVGLLYGTAAFTAGAGKLVIEYIEV